MAKRIPLLKELKDLDVMLPSFGYPDHVAISVNFQHVIELIQSCVYHTLTNKVIKIRTRTGKLEEHDATRVLFGYPAPLANAADVSRIAYDHPDRIDGCVSS